MHISRIVCLTTRKRRVAHLATNVTQQGFVVERASLNPTVTGPTQNVDEDDERDDEMSARSGKRKEIQTDTTAKELRAVVPVTNPSQPSLLKPFEETQGELERSSKQARTTEKELETLQDISYMLQKGLCGHQRNGFLQVGMVGMR